MKRFLGTFAVVLAVLLAFLLFGGSLILGNFWAMLVFCALALTVLILVLAGMSDQIEALEARIRALEGRQADAGKEDSV